MKNNKTKILVLGLFTALTLAAVTGCKDKGESSVSEDVLIQPLTFSYGSDNYDDSSSSADGLDGQDPTAPADNNTVAEYEETTEYVPVTEPNGEPVTTYVTVTDAAGQPSTDNNGETQTTAITVTTEIKVTKPVNNNQSETTTSTGNEYVPYNDSAYAMWIDISKDEDYVFNDEFIQVVFKIKDNAPDGAYDVKISNPDFASLVNNVTTVKPGKLVNGKVYVNTDAEPLEDISGDTSFVVYGDSVSGKQGEEVVFTFGLKNNPGLCAVNFWFDYDRNAMEIVECSAVGEFGEIANSTSFGNPGN